MSVNDDEGLVMSLITTPANESDMNHITDVTIKSNLPKGKRVKSDKGYTSEKNNNDLKQAGYQPQLMCKATKGKELTVWQKKYNQLISSTRYKVERTFGSMKRWFGAGKARYVGLSKTHSQHIIEAIAYNLYRSPGIIMSNALKASQ